MKSRFSPECGDGYVWRYSNRKNLKKPSIFSLEYPEIFAPQSFYIFGTSVAIKFTRKNLKNCWKIPLKPPPISSTLQTLRGIVIQYQIGFVNLFWPSTSREYFLDFNIEIIAMNQIPMSSASSNLNSYCIYSLIEYYEKKFL